MKKLPQRPRLHVLAEEAVEYTRNMIPKEWIVEEKTRDYGRDLTVEIVVNGQVTGADFSIQVKGTDSVKVRKKAYIAHSCETSTLNYFLERTEPVIYVVYSSDDSIAYWIWIQDFIRNELNPDQMKNDTIVVRLPLKNIFDKNAITCIKNRVMEEHDFSGLINVVKHSKNPYYRYNMEISDKITKISAYPKYLGAEKDAPIITKGIFKFDNTPESQETARNLENAFKTGKPIKIDSSYFEGFDIPEVFDDLKKYFPEFSPKSIEISTPEYLEKHLVKISIVDTDDIELASIPYIEMGVLYAGSEEITYSNNKQDDAFIVEMIVSESRSRFSIKLNSNGKDVSKVRSAMFFMSAIADGSRMILTNIRSGHSISSSISDKSIYNVSDDIKRFLDNLVFISTSLGEIIFWIDGISNEDIDNIDEIVGILQTGVSYSYGGSVNLSTDKSGAKMAKEMLDVSDKILLGASYESIKFRVLDKYYDLGPVVVSIPNAKPKKSSLQKIQNAENLKDNKEINLEFDIHEPGLIHTYERWKPNDT